MTVLRYREACVDDDVLAAINRGHIVTLAFTRRHSLTPSVTNAYWSTWERLNRSSASLVGLVWSVCNGSQPTSLNVLFQYTPTPHYANLLQPTLAFHKIPSVLGPVLFTAYVSPVDRLINCNWSTGIDFYPYADDTML